MPIRRLCERARMHFGDVVRRARKARGLSQGDLARLCEVEQAWLSQVEKGGKLPTLPMVEVLATQLRTTPWDLVQLMYQPEQFLHNIPAAVVTGDPAAQPMPEALMGTLGQRLRQRRLQLAISQGAMARQLDIKPTRLCDLEAGRCLPSALQLRLLSVGLQCTVHDLLPMQDEVAA